MACAEDQFRFGRDRLDRGWVNRPAGLQFELHCACLTAAWRRLNPHRCVRIITTFFVCQIVTAGCRLISTLSLCNNSGCQSYVSFGRRYLQVKKFLDHDLRLGELMTAVVLFICCLNKVRFLGNKYEHIPASRHDKIRKRSFDHDSCNRYDRTEARLPGGLS